jgi:hypothetical protein
VEERCLGVYRKKKLATLAPTSNLLSLDRTEGEGWSSRISHQLATTDRLVSNKADGRRSNSRDGDLAPGLS